MSEQLSYEDIKFKKACDSASCVGTAVVGEGVLLADTTDNVLAPGTEPILLTPAQYQGFIDGAKAGDFDLPTAA